MRNRRSRNTAIRAVSVLALVFLALPPESSSAPLVADHTAVDKIDEIPQYWIDEVKKMWVNIPGESHSSGYRKGLELLQAIDSRFQANGTEAGFPPEAYTDLHLRISGHVRNGYNGWDYGAGEQDWYTNSAGIEYIKAHLTYSNTHGYAIAALGFGWCWDMSWHNPPGGEIDPVHQVRWAGASVGGPEGDMRWGLDADDQSLTGNSVSMDTYLDATRQYIAYSNANNYPTKVFFTTGPVDSYNAGEFGYQQYLKQMRIREYVNAHDGILFDYADILTWGDDGAHPTNGWTDWGGTLRVFPTIHPDNMKDLGGGYVEDGDHIGQRGAVRLAKAMWWMLARIAGWDGSAAGEDTIPPRVLSTNPSNDASGVPIDSGISATFSELMDPATINASTFTVTGGGSTLAGSLGTANNSGVTVVTFTPASPLDNTTRYTATLTTGLRDSAGNGMSQDHVWSFTSGDSGSATPPQGSQSGGGSCTVVGRPGKVNMLDGVGAYGPLILVLVGMKCMMSWRKRKEPGALRSSFPLKSV